jgi:hypothetical protein
MNSGQVGILEHGDRGLFEDSDLHLLEGTEEIHETHQSG